MDFNFNMPARVLGGKQALLKHKDELTAFGKSALIVCGKSSAALSGALDDVKTALNELNINYEIFDGITQNPKTSDCTLAGKTARDFGAEFIIGIGGGSQLDAAKAVAVFAANEDIIADGIYTSEIKNSPLPTVLIGTTAGTGSEVTGVSVLTRENGRKKSVSGKNYYASLVFADASYTYSVPFSFTVSTAVDALSHAVESFFSNKCEINSYTYAKAAIPILWAEIKKLADTKELPDNDGRDRLYCASLLAGMALNITGTCFPHTLGYMLTEQCSVPHGFACAAFLPEFLRRAEKYSPKKAREFYSLLDESLGSFTLTLVELNDLSGVHFSKELIGEYCGGWQSVKNFDNTPGGFSSELANELISRLFG